jgi:hypothetical protein
MPTEHDEIEARLSQARARLAGALDALYGAVSRQESLTTAVGLARMEVERLEGQLLAATSTGRK